MVLLGRLPCWSATLRMSFLSSTCPPSSIIIWLPSSMEISLSKCGCGKHFDDSGIPQVRKSIKDSELYLFPTRISSLFAFHLWILAHSTMLLTSGYQKSWRSAPILSRYSWEQRATYTRNSNTTWTCATGPFSFRYIWYALFYVRWSRKLRLLGINLWHAVHCVRMVLPMFLTRASDRPCRNGLTFRSRKSKRIVFVNWYDHFCTRDIKLLFIAVLLSSLTGILSLHRPSTHYGHCIVCHSRRKLAAENDVLICLLLAWWFLLFWSLPCLDSSSRSKYLSPWLILASSGRKCLISINFLGLFQQLALEIKGSTHTCFGFFK